MFVSMPLAGAPARKNAGQPAPLASPVPFFRSQAQIPAVNDLDQLTRRYPVIATMMDLIAIPSATPQEDPRHAMAIKQNLASVKRLVIDKLANLGISDIEENPHGSLIVRIPGSPGLENRQPLLLTAHLDIVAGDENDPTKPIKPRVMREGGKEFIATDGTTTLGADDKGGVAMILDNLARLKGKHPAQQTPLPHVPLEILFSPDEESSCDSLKKLDGKAFKARHVIVVDEFDPFKVTTGLASAVSLKFTLSGLKGGHSGADITDTNRLNGIGIMAEAFRKLRTGVIKMDPRFNIPMISKNLGKIKGGYAPNAIPNEVTMVGMLRSSDQKEQDKELRRMGRVLGRLERKYKAFEPNLSFRMEAVEEYPKWMNPHSALIPMAKAAARQVNGPDVQVGPIHAAAQASLLAEKTNALGQPFDSILVGPYIKDAHSVDERIEWQSLVDAGRWLGAMIQEYTRNAP